MTSGLETEWVLKRRTGRRQSVGIRKKGHEKEKDRTDGGKWMLPRPTRGMLVWLGHASLGSFTQDNLGDLPSTVPDLPPPPAGQCWTNVSDHL